MKERKHFMFQPGIHLPIEIAGFRCTGWCVAGTVGIFFSTKQGGYLYWILAGTVRN